MPHLEREKLLAAGRLIFNAVQMPECMSFFILVSFLIAWRDGTRHSEERGGRMKAHALLWGVRHTPRTRSDGLKRYRSPQLRLKKRHPDHQTA